MIAKAVNCDECRFKKECYVYSPLKLCHFDDGFMTGRNYELDLNERFRTEFRWTIDDVSNYIIDRPHRIACGSTIKIYSPGIPSARHEWLVQGDK